MRSSRPYGSFALRSRRAASHPSPTLATSRCCFCRTRSGAGLLFLYAKERWPADSAASVKPSQADQRAAEPAQHQPVFHRLQHEQVSPPAVRQNLIHHRDGLIADAVQSATLAVRSLASPSAHDRPSRRSSASVTASATSPTTGYGCCTTVQVADSPDREPARSLPTLGGATGEPRGPRSDRIAATPVPAEPSYGFSYASWTANASASSGLSL